MLKLLAISGLIVAGCYGYDPADTSESRSSTAGVLSDASVGLSVTRRVTPCNWATTGGATATIAMNPATGSVLGDPVWRLTGSGSYRADLDYQTGDRIVAFGIDAYGDGSVDWAGGLFYSTSLGTQAGTVTPVAEDAVLSTNETASWKRHDPPMARATALVDGGRLMVLIQISGPGTLYIGKLSLLVSQSG